MLLLTFILINIRHVSVMGHAVNHHSYHHHHIIIIGFTTDLQKEPFTFIAILWHSFFFLIPNILASSSISFLYWSSSVTTA